MPRTYKLLNRKILAGITLALTPLFVIGFLLLRNVLRQQATVSWVTHTHEVLNQIDQLTDALSDAENGRRGYVISGQERYLNHHRIGRARALEAIRKLRGMVLDNSRQIHSCADLARLMVPRLELFDESIAHRQAHGLDVAAQTRFMEQGQFAMEPIRKVTGEMAERERNLLSTREAALAHEAEQTPRFTVVAAVISLGMIVWVYMILAKENRRRREAEIALQSANHQLEQKVTNRTMELQNLVTAHKQAEREIKVLNIQLEKRVHDRTIQLEVSNKELEAFSYSVSHDLRAPLRHIDGFVSLLREETNGQLSATSKRYLEVIASSARQMGELIDDLLVFSRMGRAEVQRGRVDMNALVTEVVKDVLTPGEERQIEWDIASLPEVSGDRSMLKQVWVNLLSNAVKYTRHRPVARIQVRAESSNEEWIFAVVDNGSGFDMKYVGKLFGVFQRLHSVEEFEGTGIGLANVKRVVTRHGGRTWAEGKLGEGASFFFTLPINNEAES